MTDSEQFFTTGGEQLNPDSILARLSKQAQEQIDAKMREWLEQEHEEE